MKQFFSKITSDHWQHKNKAEKAAHDVVKQNALLADVSSSLHIDFAVWLTGHDKETIEQMFNDWNRRQ